METILAIDFGTTHSLAGAFHKGEVINQIPLDPSNSDPTMLRTLIYFENPEVCHFGSVALKKFLENDMEGRLLRSFKTLLPNKFYLGTIIGNRMLTLENIIGIFLKEIRIRSEKYLGTNIRKAVIGRPARYSMDPALDQLALERMQKAATWAGFQEVQFIPEPLAAALEFRKSIPQDKTILIGDFGGGTSDFTILKITKNEFKQEDVLSVEGCPVGGDTLDSVFMSEKLNKNFGADAKYRLPMSENILSMPPHLMDRLNKPSQIVHLKEKETYHFIKEVQKCSLSDAQKEKLDRLFLLIEDQQIYSFFEEIEKTKKILSKNTHAIFEFDYPDLETKEHFMRDDFEKWCENSQSQIFEALDRCLREAQLSSHQIDHVFLTGGTAHVPFIQNEFLKRFDADRLSSRNFFHSIMYGLIESAKQNSSSKI